MERYPRVRIKKKGTTGFLKSKSISVEKIQSFQYTFLEQSSIQMQNKL